MLVHDLLIVCKLQLSIALLATVLGFILKVLWRLMTLSSFTKLLQNYQWRYLWQKKSAAQV